jgi:hypothetical protein
MAEIGISSGTFKGQKTILSANFGSQCGYIGESAFEECEFLSEINDNNVITSIGKSAFASTMLSSITFNKLTTLEDNAFCDCTNLRNISIPNCGSIPSSAFCGCTSLENVTILELNSVGNNAFENCSKLNNINLEYCSSIGENAFASCSNISQITLATCSSIGNQAFYNCNNLERVYIYNDPEYPCKIGSNVFYSDGNIIDGLTIIVRPDIYKCFSDCPDSDWSSWNTYIDHITTSPDEHTIIYTSTDGKKIDTIDKNIIENVYNENRFGFLTFDKSSRITCLNQLFKNDNEGKNNLKSIDFSPEYTEIGNNAFDGCVYLKNITVPNALTKIGHYAFKNCKSFTTFNIPDTVTEIGEGIFAGCENIEHFDGKFVTYKGKAIVYNNTLISIITKDFICDISNIDKNIQTLGSSCFHGCNNIKRLDIPANIKTINVNAFDSCENLREVHFHGNTPPVFTKNIFGNTIENIKIFVPERYIKKYLEAFSKIGDDIINKIYPIASEYDIIYYVDSEVGENNGATYITRTIKDNLSLSYYKISNIGKDIPQDYFKDNGSITKVILGEKINRISKNTFYGCKSLEYVYMPDSIDYLDDYCFYNCTSLNKIHIPYGSKNNNTTSLGKGIFEGCTSLKEFETYYTECVTSDNRCYIQNGILKLFAPSGLNIYEIKNDGNNIHTIGEDAFRETNITAITLNEYINTINPYAFYGCERLTAIKKWDSIHSILAHAFDGCNSLKAISLPNTLSNIGEYAFYNCKNMSIANKDNLPSFPNVIRNIGEHAFDGTNCNEINLKNVNFKKINDYAFANCANLGKVTINNKITEIGNGAFYNCGKLSSVVISNNSLTPVSFNLNKIGKSAFEECKQLENFYLQPSLTYIGDRAFYNSAISDTVTIPTNVGFMGDECFCECGNITGLQINSTKLTQISKSAFCKCGGLKSISIPSNINTIGENAFAYCDKLHSCNANENENFSLPNTIECIEDSAFYNCNSIESFTLPTNLKQLGDMCFYFYADSSSPISVKEIKIPKGLEEPPKFYKGGIASRSSYPFIKDTISIIVPQNYYTHYLMSPFWSKYRNYIKQGPYILG